MSSKLTVKQFFAKYPTDDTCLDHVMEVRFGFRHVLSGVRQRGEFSPDRSAQGV